MIKYFATNYLHKNLTWCNGWVVCTLYWWSRVRFHWELFFLQMCAIIFTKKLKMAPKLFPTGPVMGLACNWLLDGPNKIFLFLTFSHFHFSPFHLTLKAVNADFISPIESPISSLNGINPYLSSLLSLMCAFIYISHVIWCIYVIFFVFLHVYELSNVNKLSYSCVLMCMNSHMWMNSPISYFMCLNSPIMYFINPCSDFVHLFLYKLLNPCICVYMFLYKPLFLFLCMFLFGFCFLGRFCFFYKPFFWFCFLMLFFFVFVCMYACIF